MLSLANWDRDCTAGVLRDLKREDWRRMWDLINEDRKKRGLYVMRDGNGSGIDASRLKSEGAVLRVCVWLRSQGSREIKKQPRSKPCWEKIDRAEGLR